MIKYIAITFFVLGFLACDDEVSYDLATPQAGKQKVLVEEISGVRCPNCPDGSRLLEALNEDFDSTLIVVTYHAGNFSIPYKDSKYDYKTDQSVALMELLGRPEGYPSAAIQRVPVKGKDTYQRLPNSWTTEISEALSKESVLDLKLTVDDANGLTSLKISALFLENINRPVYMTAYLVESGLIDLQADSQSKDEYVVDYEHNHVLRSILTPISGAKWSEGFQVLDFKEDELQVNLSLLPQIVDPQKTAFVVFVHTEEGVLQVEKIDVQ